MTTIKTVSETGLAHVFAHEGIVRGIYDDDPSHHATFGIGSKIHDGPSALLIAAKAAPKPAAAPKDKKPALDPASYIKIYPKSKTSKAFEYLAVEMGRDDGYEKYVADLLSKSDGKTKKLIESESKFFEVGWDTYISDFRDNIKKYEVAVCRAFAGVELSQTQFDGLFSLTYNIGEAGLNKDKSLIAAVKKYSNSADSASAAALLDEILRASPTTEGEAKGSVDGVNYSFVEHGKFSKGLFNRRVDEASMILGQKLTKTDTNIKIARASIKSTKDHEFSKMAQDQAIAVLSGLRAIERINHGGL